MLEESRAKLPVKGIVNGSAELQCSMALCCRGAEGRPRCRAGAVAVCHAGRPRRRAGVKDDRREQQEPGDETSRHVRCACPSSLRRRACCARAPRALAAGCWRRRACCPEDRRAAFQAPAAPLSGGAGGKDRTFGHRVCVNGSKMIVCAQWGARRRGTQEERRRRLGPPSLCARLSVPAPQRRHSLLVA